MKKTGRHGPLNHKGPRWLGITFLGSLVLILGGCENQDGWKYHDPTLKMQKEDYETLTKAPESPEQIRPLKPVSPKQSYVKAQKSLPASFNKEVSLTVTKAVPLRDLFMMLAQKVGANIIVDPNIEGGATIHATVQKAGEILRGLCDNHGIRYRSRDTMVVVERDNPYSENYDLQFLILSRSNQNRVSISTDVFTGIENGARSDDDNGSSTNLIAETKTDFWQELSENLGIMLTDFDVTNLPSESGNKPIPRFTIHKQAGVISVYGNDRQQRLVQEYLDRLRANVERQVLIEAKILEVNLNDEFRSGINWNLLRASYVLQAPLGSIATPGALNETLPPPKNVFTIGGNARQLTGLISLLNKFGTVRTLSNPRLTVINNQPAVLKVARQRVYFKLNVTRDYNYYQQREEKQITSDVKTVPIGLMMYVHPTVREDGRIVMTLRPTISQVIREVADPAVSIASNNQQESFVPEIQVRELDSILSMNSGEAVIVGGLMQEESANDKSGVPEVEDIPLFGGLFSGKDNARRVTELVIFIKATIIDGNAFQGYMSESSVSAADREVYEKYAQDPRPLEF